MATYVKNDLSAATHGRGIVVATTVSPGTTIHTSVSSTTTGEFDEVWLWAVNTTTVTEKLTIQWGATTAPNDNIELTLEPEAGLVAIAPGLLLRNGLVVTAFAAEANVVTLHGFVNEIRG